MKISPKLLKEAVVDVLYQGLVPNIVGSPGIGKSEIIKSVAEELSLKVIDFRLAQADPTDLQGYPTIQEGRSTYAPVGDFPIEGDKVPDGYNGWLLFFDEANAAPQSVQAASYKIIHDRAIGKHKMHKNVAMVCAGNLTTDKAIVTRTSTALQSRMVHFELESSTSNWLDWANKNKIDHRITAFIEFRPELMHNFDPKHKDNTFPCPRTWSFASRLVSGKETLGTKELITLAGTVGEGAAIEFHSFAKIYEKIPKYKDLAKDPGKHAVPKELDIMYAFTSLIAHNVDSSDIDSVAKFVERMPKEYQVITWRSAIKRNPAIFATPYMKGWIAKNAQEMID